MPTATIRRDMLRIGDGNNPKQLILGQEEGDTSPAHQGKKKQKINNMRNRKFIYAVLALLTLGFTACQQEEDFTPQGGVGAQEIRLATRSTTYDGNDDNFAEGQVMTVAIESRTNGVWKSDFFKYTYQGGEWVSNNPMKVSDFNVLENIYMYIGYSNLNGWELNECLNYNQYMTDESNLICDQSAGFLNFDWMVPTEEITLPTAENPVITAHFIHGLAKVTVGNITYGSEYEITPEIKDLGFKSFDSSRYNDPYDNIENEFIGWNINYGIIDVKPFEEKTNGTYTAMLVTNRERNNNDEIIIPTEWTLMTLKVNGEEKTVKLVDDPATTDKNEALLEAGKHYTFDLKVGKDYIYIIEANANGAFPGWDIDSEEDLN